MMMMMIMQSKQDALMSAILIRTQVWHLLTRTTQSYLSLTRSSTNRMSHPDFTTQLQNINAVWPVLISRSTEGRRLSWPAWLVTYRG